ncbi:MAG: alkaline phosphatase family protein [Bergeyella sp.]|nr:alkaline phosphatase family protein [Bergeyella sp.]
MKYRLFFLIIFFAPFGFYAQKDSLTSLDKPKLVVGLVVDQMRWDYLYRYYDKYGEGGFKRLLKEGFSLDNVYIPYIPTVTAVGHASIYTGSIPAIHGIVGNDWIDKTSGKKVYCTQDTLIQGVGTLTEKTGQHSPRNLKSTTITDQLAMASNFRSKIVGISLKDRASVLPVGHRPTAAFWYDDAQGKFVTSTYYMDVLPSWVKDFNEKNFPKKLLSQDWITLLPLEQYTESTIDDVSWEFILGDKKKPTFPYTGLLEIARRYKDVIRTSPYGNTLTLGFAEAAIEGYAMGKGNDTDFLAVNIASTDYIGHAFGPNSVEIEDTFLRLDRDLAKFFNLLDKRIGKKQYLVFLTADHGAANSSGYLRENKMPTGFFDTHLKKDIQKLLKDKYGTSDFLLGIKNYQIYLDDKKMSRQNKSKQKIKEEIIKYLEKDSKILYAVDLETISCLGVAEPIKSRIINGYHRRRSGDIQMIPYDGYLPEYAQKGTTHGAWNSYDSHIPLLFMGWGIKHGASSKTYYMKDIAPTLAQLLKIENPSGTVGEAITEILEK